MIVDNKNIEQCNLSPEDIRDLILHVGDHAGVQGHVKNDQPVETLSCPECVDLMTRLFPQFWE